MMKKQIIPLLLCGVLFAVAPLRLHAQASVDSAQVAVIVPAYIDRAVAANGGLMKLDVKANTDYSAETSASWLTVQKGKRGLTVQAATNYSPEARTAYVALRSADGTTTRRVRYSQARTALLDEVQATGVQVPVASATDNTHQGSSDLSKSIDGNLSTIYHSNWNNDVWPEHPAELIYNFSNVARIDYINYVPRQSGSNGNFGELEIWYKTAGSSDYTKLGDYDFGKSSSATSVTIPGGLTNPTSIKFLVKTGGGDTRTETVDGQVVTKYFASCAEMQFFYNTTPGSDFDIFTDNLYTELKPGVTRATIDTLSNPLARLLGLQLIEGNYSTDYRVHRGIECVLNPSTLGEQLLIGDGYTRYQNPLGLVFGPGRTIVVANGIPDDASVSLLVKKWYDPDNVGQSGESYVLRNGVNVINKTSDWQGLGYISYFSSAPASETPIDIHVVCGTQNGYFDAATMSNAKFDSVLAAAQYPIIDLIGQRAQAVFPVADLQRYAAGKGRWLVAIYDSLVYWEQRLIGLEKYNLMPRNRIMARVNYSYYMFRDGDGVAFKFDTMNRVCSPERLTQSDEDACWGLSHEWGHVHQLKPYFQWGGLGETSNNMNSCYNTQHMGYNNRLSSNFNTVNTNFLNNGMAGQTSSARHNAYVHASESTNQALCLAMADSTITSTATDPDHALSYLEVDVFERLSPFWKLYCYMTQVVGDDDYFPDLYQMLRNTDNDTDPYSVAAARQNKESRNANVVPFQLNFIRKASLRAGVNLYPYFEDYGFFRTIALRYGDYGNFFYLMDKDTRDAFKAHMDGLVTDGTLRAMSDDMRSAIENITQTRLAAPDWSSFKN